MAHFRRSLLARAPGGVHNRSPRRFARAPDGALRRGACGAASLAGSLAGACHNVHHVREIEETVQSEEHEPRFEGKPSKLSALPKADVRQHPFMAPNGRSAMHVDSACSNTYDSPGVEGFDT